MALFAPEELDTYAMAFEPRHESLSEVLSRLEILRARNTRGQLRSLTETTIEQSFNERLFAELFGYRTLFRSGAGVYHLKPKNYVPAPVAGGRRAYTDFSLGFYGAEPELTVAAAELKGPGVDLDAPQGGGYRGQSPVEQALAAARAAGAAWALVSNFDELRLYRVDEPGAFERFSFDDASPLRVRRALALFSLASLLGDRSGPAPLEAFYRRSRRGTTMLLPPQQARIRLTVAASPFPDPSSPPPTSISLTRMSRALVTTLEALGFPQVGHPKLEGDVLIQDEPPGRAPQLRAAATTSGQLCLSIYAENRNPGPDSRPSAEVIEVRTTSPSRPHRRARTRMRSAAGSKGVRVIRDGASR